MNDDMRDINSEEEAFESIFRFSETNGSDEEVTTGDSRPGSLPNIGRKLAEGALQLLNDYFCLHPTYPMSSQLH